MKFSDLGVAAMSGNPDLVRKALAQQPDINASEGPSGFTPLLSAVAGTDSPQRQEIIEMLHAAGADMDRKDTEKQITPLHYAALRNKPLIMQALLKCGANVHATESNGATALHGAAFHGHLEACRILLRAGANARLPDAHGYTPIFLAERGGHTEILALLRNAIPTEVVPTMGNAVDDSYLQKVEARNKTAVTPEEAGRALFMRIQAIEARATNGLIISGSIGEHFQTIVREMARSAQRAADRKG
jgi:ankyrin repeat protein